MSKAYSNKWVILSLIFPGLFLFIGVILAPIVLSFYYSLTNFTGANQNAIEFIGFRNYGKMLKDPVFWRALKNSLLLALGFVVIQHPIAMLVAVTLDRIGGKVESLLRGIYFIPDVISVAIVVALWKFVYNPNFGLLIRIMQGFGFQGDFNMLDISHALTAILIVCIWHGFGWGMLIYYTGVKNVDPQLYEASALDGASGLKEFFYITLPQLRPILLYNIISALVSALKTMDVPFLLTGGGPLDQTQFLATYLYKEGFTNLHFSYGCTIGIAFVLVCLIGSLLINRAFKEKED